MRETQEHDARRLSAVCDSFCGVDVQVAGEVVTVATLRFADAMQLLQLAEHAAAGDARAAARIVSCLTRAVRLELGALNEEEFSALLQRLLDPASYAPTPPPSVGEPPAQPSMEGTRPDWPDWDELLAEYSACYGGLPHPDESWPLVCACLQRMPRFETRARLRLLDSMSEAIAGAFGQGQEVAMHREKMFRSAYGERPESKYFENAFATRPQEEVSPT